MTEPKLSWTDPKILLPLINIMIAVMGFFGVYTVTATRLQDAIEMSARDARTMQNEIVELNKRGQVLGETASQERTLSAVRLSVIEQDIKYIQRLVEEIKQRILQQQQQQQQTPPQQPHPLTPRLP